jgi:hypothetical protein
VGRLRFRRVPRRHPAGRERARLRSRCSSTMPASPATAP